MMDAATGHVGANSNYGTGSSKAGNFHRAAPDPTAPLLPPPSRDHADASDANSSAATRRFHCSKCSKTFSRIENLTRHQANHDDVGKFACSICQKRFTRSDLLNRHRKIHTAQSSSASKQHVTKTHLQSASSQSDPQADGLDSKSARTLPPRDPLPVRSNSSGLPAVQVPQQHSYYPQHPGTHPSSYQHIQQTPNPTFPGQSLALGHERPELIQSANVPQRSYPPTDGRPSDLWDGFMGLDFAASNEESYMGSYDAGLFLTLDSFAARPPPVYNADQHMMNPPDDFPDLYYYSQQYAKTANLPVEVDQEDEDSTDWPDKINEHKTSSHRAPHSALTNIKPHFWYPVLEEARVSGWSTANSTNQHTNEAVRQSIMFALNSSIINSTEQSRPVVSLTNFPPTEVLDYFIHLYMRHIHPRFPILHLPTFDIYHTPPLLLVSMMFLGSSHSNTDRGRFLHLFYGYLRTAAVRMQELDTSFLRSVSGIQTHFLLCLAGTWSGNKQYYEFAEGARAVLITACRRMRLLDCRPSAGLKTDYFQRAGLRPETSLWLAWVETEAKKRLGLCICILDFQYPSLFNIQSYVSKSETTNCAFPCEEAIWAAPTAEAWRSLVGPAEQPPPLYYLQVLNACVLRRYTKNRSPIEISDFGQLLLVYTLHNFIFEWRQIVSMINPTGLVGMAPPHDIGRGMRERRKWLVDGLDNWGDCYKSPTTPTAALLLHHLGYVALDVSLSDMHLVAGRSNNQNDGKFAEENLKYWANSKISDSTMTHIFGMLQLCHNCIRSNTVGAASYEVAVCLLTGGIVCWAYAKLKVNAPREQCMAEVREASNALNEMGCWRMSSVFARILSGFESQLNV